MQIQKGAVIEGKVTGITKYGAFVSVNGEISGMIHISEISSDFIKDINEILQINQTVKSVVIGCNENGKLALSLKRLPKDIDTANIFETKRNAEAIRQPGFENPEEYAKISKNTGSRADFEDMMNKFKRDSDEKISDLKFLEPKRSGQPRRRKD